MKSYCLINWFLLLTYYLLLLMYSISYIVNIVKINQKPKTLALLLFASYLASPEFGGILCRRTEKNIADRNFKPICWIWIRATFGETETTGVDKGDIKSRLRTHGGPSRCERVSGYELLSEFIKGQSKSLYYSCLVGG